ncbi:MAG: hypothetical protein ACRYG5_08810 [Janthinobacterium lividum]
MSRKVGLLSALTVLGAALAWSYRNARRRGAPVEALTRWENEGGAVPADASDDAPKSPTWEFPRGVEASAPAAAEKGADATL